MADAEPSDARDIDREVREKDFWGHHMESLDELISTYRQGPDPNTEAMLRAIEPVAGAKVLDFACGTGATSAWLAARGAEVLGLDITPASTQRAAELCDAVGVKAEFRAGDLAEVHADLPQFDAVIGRFALHHVDVRVVGPLLAGVLRPGGRGAFLETVYTNPLFKAARKRLVGKHVPRFGTLDEQPLGRTELDVLRQSFGEMHLELASMSFLRMVDRQVFQWRHPRFTKVSERIDDAFGRLRPLHGLSYHRVIVVRKATDAR
jgi:SAM-dependent methyltransferase